MPRSQAQRGYTEHPQGMGISGWQIWGRFGEDFLKIQLYIFTGGTFAQGYHHGAVSEDRRVRDRRSM